MKKSVVLYIFIIGLLIRNLKTVFKETQNYLVKVIKIKSFIICNC